MPNQAPSDPPMFTKCTIPDNSDTDDDNDGISDAVESAGPKLR